MRCTSIIDSCIANERVVAKKLNKLGRGNSFCGPFGVIGHLGINSLAIVTLLMCGQTFGQSLRPQDVYYAPETASSYTLVQNTAVTAPTAAPSSGAVMPVQYTTPAGMPTQYTAQIVAGTLPSVGVEPVPSDMPSQGVTPSTQTPSYPSTTVTNEGSQPADVNSAMLQPQPEMLEAGVLEPETGDFIQTDAGSGWQQHMPAMACDPSVGPCCALCGAGKCCPKQWYIDQRIRLMTHPRPRDIVFSSWHTEETVTTSSGSQITLDVYTPAVSTRTTPFNLSASYEITLGRYLGLDTANRNHFLEFTFYGTNRWSSGTSVISSQDEAVGISSTQYGVFGNLNGGRENVAGFNRADKQWVEYTASLNNFELNLRMVPRSRADRLVLHKNGKWRRECQKGIFCSWLAGLRVFTLDERFDFHSSSTINYYNASDPDTPYDTNTATGTYLTKTNNGLLGLQLGPEWILRQCRTEIGVGVRGAAYINFAEQQSYINVEGAAGDEFSDGQDIDLYQSLSRNGAAASIQVDFSASYKVRPNFILKADYELLFMSGLALAPEQVDLSLDEAITVNDGGSLLFQSCKLGFEYNW